MFLLCIWRYSLPEAAQQLCFILKILTLDMHPRCARVWVHELICFDCFDFFPLLCNGLCARVLQFRETECKKEDITMHSEQLTIAATGHTSGCHLNAVSFGGCLCVSAPPPPTPPTLLPLVTLLVAI